MNEMKYVTNKAGKIDAVKIYFLGKKAIRFLLPAQDICPYSQVLVDRVPLLGADAIPQFYCDKPYG